MPKPEMLSESSTAALSNNSRERYGGFAPTQPHQRRCRSRTSILAMVLMNCLLWTDEPDTPSGSSTAALSAYSGDNAGDYALIRLYRQDAILELQSAAYIAAELPAMDQWYRTASRRSTTTPGCGDRAGDSALTRPHRQPGQS